MVDVAETVKSLRRKLGTTETIMGEFMGVSRGTIRRWERGGHCNARAFESAKEYFRKSLLEILNSPLLSPQNGTSHVPNSTPHVPFHQNGTPHVPNGTSGVPFSESPPPPFSSPSSFPPSYSPPNNNPITTPTTCEHLSDARAASPQKEKISEKICPGQQSLFADNGDIVQPIKAKKKPKPKPKKPTDPRIKEIIDWWDKFFLENIGTKYPGKNYKADAPNIKAALATYSVKEIKGFLNVRFTTRDKFISKVGASISVLLGTNILPKLVELYSKGGIDDGGSKYDWTGNTPGETFGWGDLASNIKKT